MIYRQIKIDKIKNRQQIQNKNIIRKEIKEMEQKTKLKYGLQNASSYIKKLRQSKENQYNNIKDNEKVKQKSKIQQQAQPIKQNTKQQLQKQKQRKYKIRHQLDMNPDLNKKNKNNINIKKNKSQKLKIDNQFFQKATMIEEEEDLQKKHRIGLSDLIVINYLTSTLKIYQKDFAQLQENRDNLIQAIDEITARIQNLTELQNRNKILQLQNYKNKKQLMTLLKQYHQMKLNIEIKKIKMCENFNKKKQKIKMLLELFQEESQYVVEMQSWKQYFYELKQNQSILMEHPGEQQVLQQIFPKVDKCNETKKKEKGKVIDKSSLLGDLKNFAKNFKMPNNNNSNDF